MLSFFKEFNNRELALSIWGILFLGYFLFYNNVRKSIFNLLKIFFSLKLQIVFLSMGLYVFLCVYCLYAIQYWDYGLFKDTLFWLFGVAFLLIFKVTNKVDAALFKKTVIDSWKFTIIIDFILNLYVFSLPVELVMAIVLIFLSMMQPFTQRKKEHRELDRYINKLLSIIGSVAFGFALYKIILHYNSFFSWANMKSPLLPPILTILYMPFLYLLALFFQYEMLLVRVKLMSGNDKRLYKRCKRQIVQTARFSLKRISNISARIMKVDLHKVEKISGYINAIANSR